MLCLRRGPIVDSGSTTVRAAQPGRPDGCQIHHMDTDRTHLGYFLVQTKLCGSSILAGTEQLALMRSFLPRASFKGAPKTKRYDPRGS